MDSVPPLTFSAHLCRACGPDLVAVLVPLPTDVLQRNSTHEDGVLVFLDVKILKILHYPQLVLCGVSREIKGIGVKKIFVDKLKVDH